MIKTIRVIFRDKKKECPKFLLRLTINIGREIVIVSKLISFPSSKICKKKIRVYLREKLIFWSISRTKKIFSSQNFYKIHLPETSISNINYEESWWKKFLKTIYKSDKKYPRNIDIPTRQIEKRRRTRLQAVPFRVARTRLEFDRRKVGASSTKDTHRLYMEREQLSVRCWMTVKVSIRELRAGSFAEVSVTSDIGSESSCIRWRIGPGTSVDHRSCSLTLFEKQWRSFQIREIRIGGKFAGSSSARNKRVFRSSFSVFFSPSFFQMEIEEE